MTETGIEAFLAVCRYKSITKAAEKLYISQPSLSGRLKVLEREVGGSLFLRNKGHREISLTPLGEEFYKLALEFEKVMKKMETLCNKVPDKLRVSTINSLGTHLFPAVYRVFMEKFPETELIIQDMKFDTATKSILEGNTDVAFTTSNIPVKGIKSMVAFTEPMVMVCTAGSSYPDVVLKDMLDVNKEIYVEWSSELDQWREEFYGKKAEPHISVEIMELIGYFLMQKDRWSIVPYSVAKSLAANSEVKICHTVFEIPRRVVRCIMPEGETGAFAKRFLQCMKEELAVIGEGQIEVFI